MGERRILPYIHRHPITPSVYYDDEIPYMYSKRRRYPDHYYYYPDRSDSYYHRVYPRRYFEDYVTHRSLPPIKHADEYMPPARVVSYDHCPHCRTLPRISSKLVPSMHYDELRCQHCEGRDRRKDNHVMSFPWTPQYNDDHDRDEDRTMVLRKIEEEPIPYDTVSAPALMNGNKQRYTTDNPPPETAPPYLFLKGKDKELLQTSRKERRHRPRIPPHLYIVPEDREVSNHITPNDSISNIGQPQDRSRSFNPYRSNRPGQTAYSDAYFRTSPRKVDPTPRPIRDGRPRRQFDGHYIDIHNGKKYKYKVNYMNNGHVDSERRLVRSH